MRAAIAGDIIGSRFERSRWAGDSFDAARCVGYDGPPPPAGDGTGETAPGFDLFHPACHPTDDSALTVAVMDWLLETNGKGDLRPFLRAWFRRSPRPDLFGAYFRRWAAADTDDPCGSVGNGAAMRVGPVGIAATDAGGVRRLARRSAVATHETPDAVAGAEAVALGVFLARSGHGKDEIRGEIAGRFGYDLGRPTDAVRPGYRFTSACGETVPVAFRAFLEAGDYEGTVRRAVSVGGDADTIACMAGALAGSYWRVPPAVGDRAARLLGPDGMRVVAAFEGRFPSPRPLDG